MLEALEEALAIDVAIEGAGSPDKAEFMRIARREGLRAALSWRDARFPDGSALAVTPPPRSSAPRRAARSRSR
jgi:hypothetical protein